MSKVCPLCRKEKDEEAVFCDSCKTKIEKEYEVDVASEFSKKNSLSNEDIDETLVEPLMSSDEVLPVNRGDTRRKKKKTKGKFKLLSLIIIIFGILGVGLYFYYDRVVRINNLDKIAWDTAFGENTIPAYSKYIENFPRGKYTSSASENIEKIRKQLKDSWEILRTSDNTAQLHDFLEANPDSPYNTLIKRRLDTLTWVAVQKDNTSDSYDSYMLKSKSGEFDGDFFSEADKRYNMLYQSYPATQPEMDSIKQAVDRFFVALSDAKYKNLTDCFSSRVVKFFDLSGIDHGKLNGKQLVDAAKKDSAFLKVTPNIDKLAYEITIEENIKINVPVAKIYKIGKKELNEEYGTIYHIEMDRGYKIFIVDETKPIRFD